MPPLSLYPHLLGDAWPALAPPVRQLHAGAPGPHQGTFTVRRGAGLGARVLASLMGLPAAGEGVPVTLDLARSEGGERWQRRFAARTVVTAQYAHADLLAERFGPVECLFRLAVRDGGLCFEQVGALLRLGPLRLPLPRWICPRVAGQAQAAGERVRVEVSIAAPLVGLLVDYRGEIAVAHAQAVTA